MARSMLPATREVEFPVLSAMLPECDAATAGVDAKMSPLPSQSSSFSPSSTGAVPDRSEVAML